MLVLSMLNDKYSANQRLILEEIELQPTFLEQFRSSIWVIENCEAKDTCIKPSHEQASQVSLSECRGRVQMYTVYRGLFPQDYPPSRTIEIGVALLCASDQKLSTLISALLFATDQDTYIILPISAARGEK